MQPFLADVRAMVMACSDEVHERQTRALLTRPNADAYISAFEFHVLLITGEHDHLSTPEVHAAICASIRDAETKVIKDAGHLLPFEQPGRVIEVVNDWMASRKIL